MDRMISLSVGIKGVEDYIVTFQDLSELAKNLGQAHDYVNVSVSVVDDLVSVPDENDEEDLCHDEYTIPKVRSVLKEYGLSDKTTSDLISNLFSAGILFRERPKNAAGKEETSDGSFDADQNYS